MTEQAYSTTDPVVVESFQAATRAQHDFAVWVVAEAKILGKNAGVLRSSSLFGSYRTVGLAADDPTDPPEGWVYTKGRKQLEPRRGRTGAVARRWLAEHQPGEDTDVRGAMERHGLPRNDRRGSDDAMRFRISAPAIFEHDGEIWALYRGTPGNLGGAAECTWTPRKLSEYHAAFEAFESAAAKAEVAS